MCKIEYDNRICVYIDVLGWQDAIDKLSADNIFEILKPFLENHFYHQQHQGFIKDVRKSSNNNVIEKTGFIRSMIGGRWAEVPTMYEEVQLTVFSDTLVFSMPLDFGGRIYNKIPSIIIGFLEKEFLIRGGIALGSLYHKDHVIFGPALVESYKLELNEAKFPRILISDKVITEIGTEPYLPIMKDQLNNWVIDPFPKVIEADYSDEQWLLHLNNNYKVGKLVDIIEQAITKYLTNYSIRNKWTFQAELCAKSLEKYATATEDLVHKLRQFNKI
ncbi:hypothetical protein J2N86_09605 [Legionella lytica]|uniref:Uncharacterized protein n=1 Tax=Legionella lytica TaxID=96232 RepID=A0ABY4Y5Q5_9GAMM|nr:hypothetical protein [Legionella lytica]USQ12956.1 hypothetical protein J2N86_09605 [Legionella lytica]